MKHFFLAISLLICGVGCEHTSNREMSKENMASSNFKSKRIAKTSTIGLNAPLQKVFPLFGPIKETEWAEGWNPEIIGSQNIEEHMVFKTTSHHHGEPDYTWIVSKYAPEQTLIEYTVFAMERLWYITIKCRKNKNQVTEAQITYTYIGLTERGNSINDKALKAMYAYDLKDWEKAINYYLETGERLKHH